jgi:hypothetical protein
MTAKIGSALDLLVTNPSLFGWYLYFRPLFQNSQQFRIVKHVFETNITIPQNLLIVR